MCLCWVSHITEVTVFRVVSLFAWALITAVAMLRGERNEKLLDHDQIQSKTENWLNEGVIRQQIIMHVIGLIELRGSYLTVGTQ